MNIGILGTAFIGLFAALAGGFAGVSWRSQAVNSAASQPMSRAEVQEVQNVVPDPSDFLSARPHVVALPSQTLDETEKADLLFMREEEKLARDVYTTLYEKWGLPIFSNIAQSEQTHTEAVLSLLVKYSVQDPVTDDTVGVFVDPTFTKLYTDLTGEGLASLEGALRVGALIEDLDIYDLAVRIGRTDNDDSKFVYENLTRGSRNHLRAFAQQLTARGGTYTPEYISVDEYNSIIGSQRETGGGMGGGKGGRGWGGR